MGGGRADIDAHAFEREHLQSFDFGHNLTFFDYKVFRMIVIVDVVVHSFASIDGFLFCSTNRNPRAGRGFIDPCFAGSLRLTAYCFPMALDLSYSGLVQHSAGIMLLMPRLPSSSSNVWRI